MICYAMNKKENILKHIILNMLLIPAAFVFGVPFCFFYFFLFMFLNKETYTIFFLFFINLLILYFFVKKGEYIKIIYFLNFMFWTLLSSFLFFYVASKQ